MQGQDKFVYNCNSCSKSVETRYHCTVCEDFDLCVSCYEKEGHKHKMEKLGFDLDGGSTEVSPTSNPQVSFEFQCFSDRFQTGSEIVLYFLAFPLFSFLPLLRFYGES